MDFNETTLLMVSAAGPFELKPLRGHHAHAMTLFSAVSARQLSRPSRRSTSSCLETRSLCRLGQGRQSVGITTVTLARSTDSRLTQNTGIPHTTHVWHLLSQEQVASRFALDPQTAAARQNRSGKGDTGDERHVETRQRLAQTKTKI